MEGTSAAGARVPREDQSLAASKELVEMMLARQHTDRPSPSYLADVQLGAIEPWMREMVVQFINELGEDFQMRNDTVGLAMHYFDRYLSCTPVDKADVQLAAVACVLVAAKFSERRMPALQDLVFVCKGKYSTAEIKRSESDVVSALNWQLHAVTPHMFCSHFVRCAVPHAESAGVLYRLAEFFMDLSYYVYDALHFSPCVVGAAALLCAQQQATSRLIDCGPSRGSVTAAEAELAKCAGLDLGEVAATCGFVESELAACVRIVYSYFVQAFLRPTDAGPEAGRVPRGAEADDKTDSPGGGGAGSSHPFNRSSPDNVVDAVTFRTIDDHDCSDRECH